MPCIFAPNFLRVALAVGATSLSVTAAQAAFLRFDGDFNATFNSGSSSYQGVSSFSGSWSFIFDDSQVDTQSSGFQSFDINVVSFSYSDSSLSWTAPAAIAQLTYEVYGSGYAELKEVSIAGSPGGTQFITSDQNDYDAYYYADSTLGDYNGEEIEDLIISNGSSPGNQYSDTVSGSYSVTEVPEFAFSSTILGLAALSLVFLRRRVSDR